jgi:hypothetical protein
MSLFNYFAIQTVLAEEMQAAGCKITSERIKEVEELFRPFTDGKNLVITPRLASVSKHISFRYCGLELLQLTFKNKYKLTLEVRNSKVRRAIEISEGQALDKARELLKIVQPIMAQPDFVEHSRQKRMIPGFSMEHWLESLILSDTEGGKRAREHIGINTNLSKVVSQVPVVVTPSKTRRRALHIDLFSLNDDGKSVIVELKKDDDTCTAMKELQEYSNWFLHSGNKFDPERGTPERMIKEHYMPLGDYDYSKKGIEAVAVLMKPRNVLEWPLKDQVKLKIIELPSGWWKNPDGNPFNI